MTMKRLLVALSAVALLTGCGPTVSSGDQPAQVPTTIMPATAKAHAHTAERHKTRHPKPKHTARHRAHAGTALALLGTLAVKGRAPMTGYDRDQFGQAWLDTDRNGCDTRNDTLKRYLSDIVYKLGSNDCAVESGTIRDFYTGRIIHFERGSGTSLDIDHVVALGDTWATGSFRWPIKKRAALANDPLNLLPVDYSANRQKGDSDAASWLPSNKPFRCEYVARQITVKAKYGLWVTAAEKEAMVRVLDRCPSQRRITDTTHAAVISPVNVNVPDHTPHRTAPKVRQNFAGATVSYENCTAVRAAGAAPIYRGQPGYASHLDRDGDGVGCE
jgi:hypothetical protein